ncbi:hypothetical protein [Pseudomonas sp.]|uniref:hypothetical protein n=1 Tax=Pseudomonas sp. TaxID=306 RepID=UPI002FCA680E
MIPLIILIHFLVREDKPHDNMTQLRMMNGLLKTGHPLASLRFDLRTGFSQESMARHPVQRLRAWSALYTEQRATADSKSTPWEPADVVDFLNRLEKMPASHRELWNLAIDRLQDLKHDH